LGISLIAGARLSLVCVIVLLYYGSLYPGTPKAGVTLTTAWLTLMSSWYVDASNRLVVDGLLNILIYIPLGFCFVLAFRWPWPWRIAGAVLVGSCVSFSVEILQVFFERRYSSLLDWVTNTMGSALGGVAGWVMGETVGKHLRSGTASRGMPDSWAMLGAWLLSQWFPLLPALSLYRLSHKLEALARSSIFRLQTLVIASEWVVLALIVERVAGASPIRWLLLALTVLPLRLFIHTRELGLGDVVGALLGVTIWRVTLFRRPWRNWGGLAVIIAGVMVSQLIPFRFQTQPVPFSWRPFHASLQTANWEPALLVLTTKVFRYGAVIWMLRQCGAGYPVAGVLVAAALFATEWAQRYLPGRAPEIADSVLALMVAVLLWMTHKAGVPERKRR
jgi:VanZ family protein